VAQPVCGAPGHRASALSNPLRHGPSHLSPTRCPTSASLNTVGYSRPVWGHARLPRAARHGWNQRVLLNREPCRQRCRGPCFPRRSLGNVVVRFDLRHIHRTSAAVHPPFEAILPVSRTTHELPLWFRAVQVVGTRQEGVREAVRSRSIGPSPSGDRSPSLLRKDSCPRRAQTEWHEASFQGLAWRKEAGRREYQPEDQALSQH